MGDGGERVDKNKMEGNDLYDVSKFVINSLPLSCMDVWMSPLTNL